MRVSDDRPTADRCDRAAASSRDRYQKNLREMLKPRYQSSLFAPPRAIWASVVPKPFEKFSWKHVAAGPLLDAEADVVDAGIVAADPRRAFDHQVDGRPDAQRARRGR